MPQPLDDTGTDEHHLNRLLVYGQDHSPWVQSVLLGLHEKQLSYRLTTVPSFSILASRGFTMPAIRFDSNPWVWESTDILLKLGFETPTTDESTALRSAWQGVVHRADHPLLFFRLASRISDPERNLLQLILKQMFRGFIVVYFFILLNFVRLARLIRNPDSFVTQFSIWNDKLASSEADFFGGNFPSQCDLQLFGIVQCHCSIPSPVLSVLTDAPELVRLRQWIGVMQLRFRNFPHLYSGACFSPHVDAPIRAGTLQRVAFSTGVLLTILFLPIALPVMVFNAVRTHYFS